MKSTYCEYILDKHHKPNHQFIADHQLVIEHILYENLVQVFFLSIVCYLIQGLYVLLAVTCYSPGRISTTYASYRL
jgi:hypothetical protein